MGNDIGTGRTEGIEPIKRVFTYLEKTQKAVRV